MTEEAKAFTNIDYAFLVGAMPRKGWCYIIYEQFFLEGMERKDLLAANVKIFKSQGLALAKYSNPSVKVKFIRKLLLKTLFFKRFEIRNFHFFRFLLLVIRQTQMLI